MHSLMVPTPHTFTLVVPLHPAVQRDRRRATPAPSPKTAGGAPPAVSGAEQTSRTRSGRGLDAKPTSYCYETSKKSRSHKSRHAPTAGGAKENAAVGPAGVVLARKRWEPVFRPQRVCECVR